MLACKSLRYLQRCREFQTIALHFLLGREGLVTSLLMLKCVSFNLILDERRISTTDGLIHPFTL